MAGRPCTVCTHPDRREIELAAARGEASRAIARRFAPLTRYSLDRHLADHAPRAMEKALVAAGAKDLASGLGLNEEVQSLQDRTLAILTKAEKSARTLGIAIGAIREARGNLELLAKLTGKLRPDTQVNVLVASPEWLALRERILGALEAHPAALAAVQEAMGAEPR